jgi:hypothetical protein
MTYLETSNDIATAKKLIGRIAKILANNPETVQGVVLADLLATWIGGHFVPGDRKGTSTLRKDLMREHVKLVADLIPHNEPAVSKVDFH